MSMSREEFKAAFREVISSEFAYIPTDESSIDFTFSEKFIKRMDKLIRAQRKNYYKFINTAGKRVAVIFAAIITLFTASLSVKAIREPVVKFIKQVYETFTHYSFEGDTTKKIEKEYFVTNLPDGYFQADKIESDITITTIYKNNSGGIIKFCQQISSNSEHTFDSEKMRKETMVINEQKYDIYYGEQIANAIWAENGYVLTLTIYDTYNTETIENILIGIK